MHSVQSPLKNSKITKDNFQIKLYLCQSDFYDLCTIRNYFWMVQISSKSERCISINDSKYRHKPRSTHRILIISVRFENAVEGNKNHQNSLWHKYSYDLNIIFNNWWIVVENGCPAAIEWDAIESVSIQSNDVSFHRSTTDSVTHPSWASRLDWKVVSARLYGNCAKMKNHLDKMYQLIRIDRRHDIR